MIGQLDQAHHPVVVVVAVVAPVVAAVVPSVAVVASGAGPSPSVSLLQPPARAPTRTTAVRARQVR